MKNTASAARQVDEDDPMRVRAGQTRTLGGGSGH
jgi:hypothetical protein